MSETSPFRSPFLWGASTSAHQTEGNNVLSDFWRAENDGSWGLADRSGDACDSYHRWREDLDLVAELGLDAYRFGIEWARIMPTPAHCAAAELAHYRRIIEGCAERGITPVVTLHHFTSPAWLQDIGGWSSDAAADHFARYVREVIPILDGVEWVCTINEPNMVALMVAQRTRSGASTGVPPLPPDPWATRGLTAAHRAARALLRDVPGVRSGWTVANQNVQDHGAGAERAAEISYVVDDRFLEVAADDDFVGVQAYSRLRLGAEGIVFPGPEDRLTKNGWEFYPRALEESVRHTADVVGPDVPILVTENGIATDHDAERIEYTRDALEGMRRAIADGIDVRGYLHWSLLDDYEWGSWSPTFGLVAVDRRTFARTIKPSGRWYAQAVAVARGAG